MTGKPRDIHSRIEEAETRLATMKKKLRLQKAKNDPLEKKLVRAARLLRSVEKKTTNARVKRECAACAGALEEMISGEEPAEPALPFDDAQETL
jgi:hypothetical protein